MFWVGISSLIIYKTNFFRQVWENPNVSPMFMNLALIALGVNLAILIYVTLIMPLQGKEPDIEKVPQLIPVMTVAGVFLPIFLIVALWPIWGFLTPIYILVLTFGYIFSLTFLPDGKCGTIVFWILMIGIATLSHELPHAGYEHSW